MEAVMWVVQNRHVGSKGKTGVCHVIAQRGAFEGVTKLRFQSQLVAIRRGQQLPQPCADSARSARQENA